MEYYSAIRKNEIMSFAATCLDLELIILSEVRKRKTNTIWYHLYVESKIWHKWIYLWNRSRLTDLENRLVVAKGKGKEGLGIQDYIVWMNNKVLLYSTGHYIQYPVINHNESKYENIYVCIYIYMCVYIYFIFFSNMVYLWVLNIVPCAV